jgi:molybdopterin molybdotransferase
MTLSLSEARAVVIDEVTRARDTASLATEAIPIWQASGRVLAVDVRADRDQPPFDRSTRDGFAVRAADLAGIAGAGAPISLRLIGEVAAGATFTQEVEPGTTVEIMTGAPVPAGADAVVMIEHTDRAAGGSTDPTNVKIGRAIQAGENIVPKGSELRQGVVAKAAGSLLDPASLALLASLGCAQPRVFVRPKVAILGTGDELVAVDATPGVAQIRDSNRYCLAALIERAGGQPLPLPIAPDQQASIEAALAQAAAEADIILVSGGVSMGKYDHVEAALAKLSARIVFDGVAIRPGKPLVFGLLGKKPLFGLPGNPLSAQVTFQLFGAAAVELWGGRRAASPLPFFAAQLAADHAQRSVPLTVFVPAAFARTADLGVVTRAPRVMPLPSQGSGDLAAMAAADGFLVIEPGVSAVPAGAWVTVLPK